MFQIETLATGSSGNAYLISSGSEKLLLEAGLTPKAHSEALMYDYEGIQHCLISHSHADHSKGVKALLKLGIDCYMSEATANELSLNHHRVHHVESLKKIKLGSFTVLPFSLEHDVPCMGYLIGNEAGEKLLFITDTYFCRYRFKGITHLMIEVNYCEATVDRKILEGLVHQKFKKRLIKSHFSLENVVEFIHSNDFSSLQEVHCLHLSDRNSDQQLIKQTISGLVGKPVYIP